MLSITVYHLHVNCPNNKVKSNFRHTFRAFWTALTGALPSLASFFDASTFLGAGAFLPFSALGLASGLVFGAISATNKIIKFRYGSHKSCLKSQYGFLHMKTQFSGNILQESLHVQPTSAVRSSSTYYKHKPKLHVAIFLSSSLYINITGTSSNLHY